MTLAEFASLAEVIGALGVIAGLIFVGLQLRQATLQLRRAEANAANAEASVLRQAVFSDGEFAEIVSACVRQSRPLSTVETDRLTIFFWEIGFQIIQFWDRAQHGLFTRREFERLTPIYVPYLTSPIGRQWWQVARTLYRPDFVADLERLMPTLTAPITGEAASTGAP